LVAVESAGGSWYRFVVTGNIVGGRLKTPADADAESPQVQHDTLVPGMGWGAGSRHLQTQTQNPFRYSMTP
jgi:hypothetical protein